MNFADEIHLSSQIIVRLIDVTIIAYLIYRALLVIRGTRAAPMLWGLTIITIVYFVAKPLGLVTLAWLIDYFLSSIILVIVVIFQDEIRRALTKVGVNRFFLRASKTFLDKSLEDITLSCTKLSKAKLGAIIVIQREVGLDEFLEDSVILDANLSRKLLYSIFVKDSPLHDGALIIDGDRIRAAGCVLPLSFNPDLDPNLGTRHRAALGLSERSDAIVIVISEESGAVSIARDGKLVRNLEAAALRDTLVKHLAVNGTSEDVENDA